MAKAAQVVDVMIDEGDVGRRPAQSPAPDRPGHADMENPVKRARVRVHLKWCYQLTLILSVLHVLGSKHGLSATSSYILSLTSLSGTQDS